MAAGRKRSNSSLLNKRAMMQLLLDLLETPSHPLTIPLQRWVTTSKPFAMFAQQYQPKIRKKIRICRNHEETYNLYCELRTAFILLQESKFALTYEPHAPESGRSADLAVAFRTHAAFDVEITRLSASQQEQRLYEQHAIEESDGTDRADLLLHHESRRLADVVSAKLSQMTSGTANILWVWSESRLMQALDVGAITLDLKQRAEQKDPALLSRYGFVKPAGFFRSYQRLSAIVVHSLHERRPDQLFLWWQNRDARFPLPSNLVNRLHVLIAADTSLPFVVNPDDGSS